MIHLMRFGFLFVVFSACFNFTHTVRAQVPPCVPSSNVTVIATGLNNPRGLKFGPDGQLYSSEHGRRLTTRSTSSSPARIMAGPMSPAIRTTKRMFTAIGRHRAQFHVVRSSTARSPFHRPYRSRGRAPGTIPTSSRR